MRVHRSWTLAVLALLAAPAASAATLDLPLKTWVERPLPADGEGACPSGHCKHMRITPNPVNGRLYFCGGDYSMSDGFLESGRQNVFSYSIVDSTWRQEFPYCAPLGQVQPSHPDEVGWVYDTRRNIFWMIPGYMGIPGDADGGLCPNPLSSLIRWEIMTFDPSGKQWTWPNSPELTGVTLGDDGFAQYDPVTDTIIQFYYDSFPGVGIFDIQSNTWTKTRYPGNARLSKEYTAFDPVDRAIYVLEGYQQKLYKYDIDAKTLTAIADLPDTAQATQTRIAWDPVNRIVAWARWGGSTTSVPDDFRFWAYHPDTGQWESLAHTVASDGGPAYGLTFTYDPAANAFLLIGQGTATQLIRPYFFIYRYGNGGPPQPPDTAAPAAIRDVRPR